MLLFISLLLSSIFIFQCNSLTVNRPYLYRRM
ncbi:hypothetical protein GYH30_005934 [Glycine max]|nr:hypothetical protein GYH30_005934 [Glycine max]